MRERTRVRTVFDGVSAHSALRICVLVMVCSTSTADAGPHTRLETDHGPVHVWTPPKYDAQTAGIVVYIHGYFADVDDAWKEHHLARQFAESKLNAMFIACEAPRGPRDPISWTSLTSLLDAVARGISEDLPAGHVIVVGHSGAHRTLAAWIEADHIDTVVLLDALYGEVAEFRAWLDADSSRRLIDAARLTKRWTDELHADLPETLVFNRFPPPRAGRLRGARAARVVYVRSQHDHMALVTGGIALPMLLRAVDLPIVKNASRRAPIRAL